MTTDTCGYSKAGTQRWILTVFPVFKEACKSMCLTSDTDSGRKLRGSLGWNPAVSLAIAGQFSKLTHMVRAAVFSKADNL